MWKKILGGNEPEKSGNPENKPTAAPATSQTEITMSDQVQEPKADIGKQQIGTVYAKAFLAASAKNKSVDADLEEFGALVASVIEKQPVFEETLASPRVAVEEKIALLDKTLKGRVSDRLLTFVKVVCQHERLDCLREIYLAARQQHNDEQGVARVHVTTAETLDSSTAKRVEKQLTSFLNKKVDLVKNVDPAIIGGMIIRIGDMVYDTSVRQKLASIRTQTVDNTAQQMRESLDRFAPSS